MKILDYLFVEPCRVCGNYVEHDSLLKTFCPQCWQLFSSQEAKLEICRLDDFCLNVAHGLAYEGKMKQLIYRFKYDGDRLLAHDFSILLASALAKLESAIDVSRDAVLVPIPLHYWRMFRRGYNQSELLSKYLSRMSSIGMNCRLLRRRKNTLAQHKLNKEARRINLGSAFACKLEDRHKDASIILIDDIYTSGATLKEAARTLLESGAAQVSAITVARAIGVE